MKKLLLVLIAVLPLSLFAQNTSGVIIYQEKIKNDLEEKMSDEDKAQLEQLGDVFAQMGDFKNEKQLLFNSKASVYKDYKAGDNAQTIGSEDGGAIMMMVMSSPEEIIYQDLENEKVIEQTDFMDKKFLLNYDMKASQWKMAGEQKEILGYTCQKALLNDTAESVVAWFTLQIPVPSGPSVYGQLPGMIMEVSIDDASNSISHIVVRQWALYK